MPLRSQNQVHSTIMSSQLVPITIEVDRECALVSRQIATAQHELWQLQHELAPLETAFGLFEQKVAAQSAGITAERNALRRKCQQIEYYTNRLHARMCADPGGHLDEVFSPAELRAIGDLFGIEVPSTWFGEASRATTSDGSWEWADDTAPDQRSRALPADDAAELRQLYLELAKAYHPDLAADPEEHLLRTEMMLRINLAWQTQDLSSMRDLHRGSTSLMNGGSARTQLWHLEQLRRDLAQILARCAQARARLQSLRQSKTRALWHDAALANAAIARHVRRLEQEVRELQAREKVAIDEFRIAFGQYVVRS